MRITFIGTGYVGLVSGTCFAELGHEVICVDHQKEKIDLLESGEVPIYEPGLEALVAKNKDEGRLSFTTDLGKAVKQSDVIFIAVGTPSTEDGSADLSFVHAVAEEMAETIDDNFKIIVNKSTVPMGTAESVENILKSNNSMANVEVCSVPEFLREGTAIHDTFQPDRVVIGTSSKKAEKVLIELHQPLTTNIVTTGVRSAEMIKYAANAFLATKISYINEIANICDLYDADVKGVAEAIGLDHRIGPKFLNPGIGYGGSCFPKDIRALVYMAKVKQYEPELLQSVEKVNRRQSRRLIQHLDHIFNDHLKGLTVAVLGLAFKPNTDDMRDAPSIKVTETLIERGADVKAYDPVAVQQAKKVISSKVQFCESPMQATEHADAVLIVTEWDEFKKLSLSELKQRLAKPIVIDGRNIFEPEKMRGYGFIYHGIGRK